MIKRRIFNMVKDMVAVIADNSFFRVLILMVILDTILGVGRALKEHKFNSSVGIDGAIRKVMVIASVVILMAVDMTCHFNILFMVPEEYIKVLGIQKLGLCEFFSLLYILYEAVSCMKNMVLCGLPVPARMKTWVEKFLTELTTELDEKETKQ